MPMFFLSFFLLLYIFLITFSQSFIILLITFSQSFMLLSGVTEIVANTSEVKILIAHVIQKQFSQIFSSTCFFFCLLSQFLCGWSNSCWLIGFFQLLVFLSFSVERPALHLKYSHLFRLLHWLYPGCFFLSKNIIEKMFTQSILMRIGAKR